MYEFHVVAYKVWDAFNFSSKEYNINIIVAAHATKTSMKHSTNVHAVIYMSHTFLGMNKK